MKEPFSALLLAGGKSSRMGRDKASVLFEGETLWGRQLDTLRKAGAAEVLICGHEAGPYCSAAAERAGYTVPGEAYEVLLDEVPGSGPLGAIYSGLKRARFERVLVLAVDMPRMTAGWLRGLLFEAGKEGRGVVGKQGRGYEPLAAVYGKSCMALMGIHLAQAEHSMQRFVRAAIAEGLLGERSLKEAEQPFFWNINTESDLRAAEGQDPDRDRGLIE